MQMNLTFPARTIPQLLLVGVRQAGGLFYRQATGDDMVIQSLATTQFHHQQYTV